MREKSSGTSFFLSLERIHRNYRTTLGDTISFEDDDPGTLLMTEREYFITTLLCSDEGISKRSERITLISREDHPKKCRSRRYDTGMGMRDDLSDSTSISRIWCIGDLDRSDQWKYGIDGKSEAMKWWKKSYDSLTLVEWHERKSSLDISEDILMGEYYSLRKRFASGGEEHDYFFSKFWKEKKSLSNHCSELRG